MNMEARSPSSHLADSGDPSKAAKASELFSDRKVPTQ